MDGGVWKEYLAWRKRTRSSLLKPDFGASRLNGLALGAACYSTFLVRRYSLVEQGTEVVLLGPFPRVWN